MTLEGARSASGERKQREKSVGQVLTHIASTLAALSQLKKLTVDIALDFGPTLS